ncbi:MAG: HAD-IB family phosphatase [Anaerolineae bacterium]|nr:HAD-IB family phosphatase [Anaerolineae bacterium]
MQRKNTNRMTNAIPWTNYDLIFFDCDSTLSAIEGIDELARFKGKEWRVSVLTQKAMDGELDLSDVYGKRLQAIRPTRGQLKAIEERYWDTIVPDAQATIDALKYLGKQVFIISGGLAEPVRGFGVRLGVPAEHIRAVQLEYNELSGNWWRYYEPSEQASQSYLDFDEGPLTVSNGKSAIIRELTRERRGRIMMIGDGSSDLATRPVVDLFVGFGGVVARENVKDKADVFVQVNSLASIVPMACGFQGYAKVLNTPHQAVFEHGLAHIRDHEVLMRSELMQAFEKEFQRNED